MKKSKIFVPGQLRFLSDVIGEEATFAFIENVAGKRISIPKKTENSIFEQTYGSEIARLCAEEWGTGQHIIPRFNDWRIRKLKTLGLSHNEIASRVGCHYNAVSQTLQRRQKDDRRREREPSLEEIFPQIEMFQ